MPTLIDGLPKGWNENFLNLLRPRVRVIARDVNSDIVIEEAPEECIDPVIRYAKLKGDIDEEAYRLLINKKYSAFLEWLDGNPDTNVVIVWGGAGLMSRPALFAAKRLGIPAVTAEAALLQPMGMPNEASLMLYQEKPYFEALPNEFTAWKDYDYDPGEIEKYIQWIRENRLTKPTHQGYQKNQRAPQEWIDSHSKIIWFSQLPIDAATLWQIPEGAADRIVEDCRRFGAFRKPHPEVIRNNVKDVEAEGIPTIPHELNIHILMESAKVVVTMNSNTGMEAWMYDLPVAIYGEPIYKHPGLASGTIEEALNSPIDKAARHQFLAYLRDVHHLKHGDDVRAKIESILTS